MALAVDQQSSNIGTTGTSGTVTLPSVAANALVILIHAIDDDGATTITAPTATGLTFVQIGTTLNSAGNYYLAIWRAYTASSLGSTVITAHWNVSADWKLIAISFTGTSGTAGNNGSDAIGNSNSSNARTVPCTVNVTSSAHNNSTYLGAIVTGNGTTNTITPGAAYTTTLSVTWSTWLALLAELSTTPVTPAATTTVDGNDSTLPSGVGIFGVELLVFTGAVSTPNVFDNDADNQQSNDVNFSVMQEADDFPTKLPPPNPVTPSDGFQPIYADYIWLGGDE